MRSCYLPLFSILLITACKYDHAIDTADYPRDIGNIIVTKCAVSGCHNTQSADAAGGIDYTTWESMMNGGNGGATVVPYSHSQSLIYLFTNTYPDIGASVQPTMPYNGIPLSKEEVLAIRYWVNAGAPNKDGFVKWSDNPQRRKYYIANRGCDVVATVDPTSSLVMRYIDVGNVYEIEKPAAVKISLDGAHWYVSFANGDVLQQFSTIDDVQTGELNIGYGDWSSMCISSDSKTAYLVNTDSTQSELAIVDLETMTLKIKYSASLLGFATTVCLDETNNKLFIGSKRGNFIYTVNITDPLNATFNQLTVQPGNIPDINGTDNPNSVYLNTTTNRYYIVCTGTGQLNEYDAATNQLLSSIFVGLTPQNIAYDATHNYFFIACTDDSTTLVNKHGYVTVVDATSLSVIQKIYTGTQPYGLAVDESLGRLVVANRNFSNSGPPPHHHVECDGRVGTFSYIDLNTLTWINTKGYELSVEPFDVAVRN